MQYPKHVDIIEIGPRDGFQNVKELIPTQTKIDIINAMAASGVKEMQLTSFVNPRAIPQMADAGDVARAILGSGLVPQRPMALAPNYHGVKNAFESGLRTVSVVISATEGHNKANVNRSKKESVEDLKKIIADFPEVDIRIDIAMAFGCPFDGWTPQDDVLDLMKAALDSGVKEVVLCDSIGIGNPAAIVSMAEKALAISTVPLAFHIHDTRGRGLANMLAAMQAGIHRFETSIAGLGGCPFAPGAAGNTATEDAVALFESMGIDTGIDLKQYLKAVALVKERVNATLNTSMGVARIYEYEDIYSA